MADLIKELIDKDIKFLWINVDIKSAIQLAKTPAFNSHSKHIKFQYHSFWKCVEYGKFEVHHVATEEQHMDILTNSLEKIKIIDFMSLIHLDHLKD